MILSDNPRVALVRLRGDYDRSRGEYLERQLSEAYGVDIALLDMRDVTNIDTALCPYFVRLKKRLRRRASLRMIGSHAHIRQLLRTVYLNHAFDQYETLGEALAIHSM